MYTPGIIKVYMYMQILTLSVKILRFFLFPTSSAFCGCLSIARRVPIAPARVSESTVVRTLYIGIARSFSIIAVQTEISFFTFRFHSILFLPNKNRERVES